MTLTDQQLNDIFTDAGFDGIWSPLSRLLALLHKVPAEKIWLNTGWAMTAQNFRCPVCLQRKPDLIRKTTKGLVAMLHTDHDHRADAMAEFAKEAGIGSDYSRIRDRFLSYHPTLICRPCNLIDSRMKIRMPEIEPHFSLKPADKSALIIRPGRSAHKLNFNLGRKLWLQQSEDFFAQQKHWEREIMDLEPTDTAARHYQPKKVILRDAETRYIRALLGFNYNQEFYEFIRISVRWFQKPGS